MLILYYTNCNTIQHQFYKILIVNTPTTTTSSSTTTTTTTTDDTDTDTETEKNTNTILYTVCYIPYAIPTSVFLIVGGK